MKTGYPYRFQGLHCIEKRSDTPGYFLDDYIIEKNKELENALVLLCRNSTIHCDILANISDRQRTLKSKHAKRDKLIMRRQRKFEVRVVIVYLNL